MDKTITISAPANITPASIAPYTLFYRDIGAGVPTLLLHGFAEDNTVWDNQVDALGTTCRLIIPDLPGSGRSSPLAAPSSLTTPNAPTSLTTPNAQTSLTTPNAPTTMEELAAVIKGLLDQLNIEKCILIGHSMGGYITLAFAALYPERLQAFGLFHSTAYPDSEDKKTTRRKAIEFIQANGAAPFVRQSTPNLFSTYTRGHRPGLIDTTIEKYSTFAPQSLTVYYESMIARPDRTAVLRQFTGPVFFLMGEADTIIPLQQGLEQCYLPSISHLHIVKDAGHMAMLEAPEKSNQLLRDFINFVTQI